ncbi:hypothetical protein K461DRAFT_227878 [Myriangium duriaei CBS 260.36]|uniref:SP-RING-type domain-containing protein n=1 Tax=Myriangium duriaei CBS 260.36 TaxID=1168546 RepID=A0A9P4IY97_9PEZI|nr:hypothetical protein K461DRAFT_227878 [Myriangium duriaei CBS 260.36]
MALTDLSTARQSTVNRLKGLLNQDLKEICRQENLQVSGVKAQLQGRITQFMDDAINRRDLQTFERLRFRVMNKGATPPPGYTGTDASGTTVSMNSTSARPPGHYDRPSLPPPSGQRTHASVPKQLTFKASPFYTIQDHITRMTELPMMPQNRHSISVAVPLTDNVCERLRADSRLRVMLYCAPHPTDLQPYQVLRDIGFPSQIEVKMNQEDVKHNYKGLKNKPGTTKPVDLTSFLRKQPHYPNNLQINYALNSVGYSLVVNLVHKASAEDLTEKVRRGRAITKDTVLREMSRKARDPDIEATSYVMSLKDPVSTMRMDVPVRSTVCTHSQCFDALSFIQLQEQAPTWTCPICSKVISYEALALDHYVLDILNNTSKSVDQVVIEPEGAWREVNQNEDNQRDRNQARAAYDDDSDDDLVEIRDVKSGASQQNGAGQMSIPGLSQHMTPPLSSREASVSQNSRNKRPSAVIDLTMSDDDEPPRPAKRPTVATSYNTPSSNSDKSQDIQHRSMPTTLYTGFATMRSPQSAQATSPRPPDINGQSARHSPWPANYAMYGANPWNGGQYPHQQ